MNPTGVLELQVFKWTPIFGNALYVLKIYLFVKIFRIALVQFLGKDFFVYNCCNIFYMLVYSKNGIGQIVNISNTAYIFSFKKNQLPSNFLNKLTTTWIKTLSWKILGVIEYLCWIVFKQYVLSANTLWIKCSLMNSLQLSRTVAYKENLKFKNNVDLSHLRIFSAIFHRKNPGLKNMQKIVCLGFSFNKFHKYF